MSSLPELRSANRRISSSVRRRASRVMVLALDRQERGQGTLSAVQEVEATYAVRCVSIITLSDLIESLTAASHVKTLEALRRYRSEYGI